MQPSPNRKTSSTNAGQTTPTTPNGEPSAKSGTGPQAKADGASDIGVIPVAYAVVSSGKPGEFYAVRLHGVMAEHVEHLVPGAAKATKRAFALQRVLRIMQIDCVKKLFG